MPSLKFNPDGSPHTHTYVRRDKLTMKCHHPQCTHYMAKQDLKGKESLCSVCGIEKLLLTREQLKLARPRCVNCSNSKAAKQRREITAKLQELGIS